MLLPPAQKLANRLIDAGRRTQQRSLARQPRTALNGGGFRIAHRQRIRWPAALPQVKLRPPRCTRLRTHACLARRSNAGSRHHVSADANGGLSTAKVRTAERQRWRCQTVAQRLIALLNPCLLLHVTSIPGTRRMTLIDAVCGSIPSGQRSRSKGTSRAYVKFQAYAEHVL